MVMKRVRGGVGHWSAASFWPQPFVWVRNTVRAVMGCGNRAGKRVLGDEKSERGVGNVGQTSSILSFWPEVSCGVCGEIVGGQNPWGKRASVGWKKGGARSLVTNRQHGQLADPNLSLRWGPGGRPYNAQAARNLVALDLRKKPSDEQLCS